ncbi:hypothetical protein LTR50_002130 [Elasticomyces elasticus]|nr:hypothetical protein LTR50_002130 [Elasticomyces elasticus]
MLHESGTGGAPKYGVIPQMPLTTLEGVNVLDNLTYMQPRVGDDVAQVGYYKTHLANGVVVEMAASMHAGLMQYTFPRDGGKYILVDLSHYLPTQDDHVPSQFYSNGELQTSVDGKMYGGYGVWRGGWNEGLSNGTIFGPSPYPTATFVNGTYIRGGTIGYDYANRVGAVFEFPPNTTTLRSRIGVSWISYDKACAFANEISGYNMNATISATQEAWTHDILDLVQISDTSNRIRLEMFYSALYRAHLLPSDRTGENPYWTSSGPYYDDFYTIWDTFRCLNSFYLLTQPHVAEGLILTLIDIWKHERSEHDIFDRNDTKTNAMLLQIHARWSEQQLQRKDAYVKGLRGAINWTEGYMAMKTDAEVIPYNNFDPQDLTGSTKEGRGALPDWLAYGFVTPAYGRSISKTVEYSLNDYSLSVVAQGEAPQDYAKYLNRFANGTILAGYDPLSCGECEWTAICYEALPCNLALPPYPAPTFGTTPSNAQPGEYSWTVPFDMSTLISFMGGPTRTESRLDAMFLPGIKTTTVGSGGTNGIGSTLFNPGNEPSFATPFLYNYLRGRQWKSVLRSRQVVDQYYSTAPSGLPGNSDAGAIDSWLVWNLLGLYPVVTQPVYLLLSPWFADVTVKVGGNGSLRITAEGLGDESFYVQSVKVNGVVWNQSWVSHEDLVGSGRATIEFVLGAESVSWDTGSLPPSPGHVVL